MHVSRTTEGPTSLDFLLVLLVRVLISSHDSLHLCATVHSHAGSDRVHCVAEALEAWKKVENSIVSFTAVGISIDSEAASEASAACATAQALIVSLFPAGPCLLPCHLKLAQPCVTTYESVLF